MDEAVDKSLVKKYRKIKFRRLFHRDDYVYATWVNTVKTLYKQIQMTEALVLKDRYNAARAPLMSETFGRFNGCVKQWRCHKLFHSFNIDRVDTMMTNLLPIFKTYVEALMDYDTLETHSTTIELFVKAQYGEMEIDDVVKTLHETSPSDLNDQTEELFHSLVIKSFELKQMEKLVLVGVTNIKNVVLEDLLEIITGVDVVAERRHVSYVIHHSTKQPNFKYVDMTDLKWNAGNKNKEE